VRRRGSGESCESCSYRRADGYIYRFAHCNVGTDFDSNAYAHAYPDPYEYTYSDADDAIRGSAYGNR
jgi:hypothetical protein